MRPTSFNSYYSAKKAQYQIFLQNNQKYHTYTKTPHGYKPHAVFFMIKFYQNGMSLSDKSIAEFVSSASGPGKF